MSIPGKILNSLRKNSITRGLLLRLSVKLHNFSYSSISYLVSFDGKHPKHQIMNYHQFFLDNIDSSDVVLDIGCGNGLLSFDLSKNVKRVVAIDILPDNIKKAIVNFSAPNIEYIIGDATTYKFDTVFNVIVLSNVLEHIDNRVDFLCSIKKIAPKLLIRVPLITRDWLSVYKKNNNFPYLLDPSHYIEYTEDNFKKEVEGAGLKLVNCYVKFGELYAVLEA